MNVFVTGASGFLGQYLIRHLVEEKKYTVFSLCRNPLKIPGVTHLQADMSQHKELVQAMKQAAPEQIYHLAGLSRIHASLDMPEYFYNNTATTLSLIEAVKTLKKPTSIFFSSSMHVYGNNADTVNEETMVEPASPYAFTKFLAEQALKNFILENPEHKCVVGRLYSCFGPGQPEGFVARDLIKKVTALPEGTGSVLKTGPLKTFRRFLDVRDVVRVFPTLLENSTKSNYEIFNIASPHELEIAEMLNLILEMTGKSPKIESSDETSNSFKGLKVDTKKLFSIVPESQFRKVSETLKDMLQDA